MPKKEAGAIVPIILLILLMAIGVIGFLVYRGLVKIPGLSQSPTSINLQSQYQNPFNKSAQYVNPFSQYKNPFDSLK